VFEIVYSVMDSYTEPDYANCALLTIDVQNDFTLPGSKLQILGTAEAVPNIRRILEQFRLVGKPIVHIIRFYLVDGSNVDLCRRSMVEDGKKVVVPNTFGADLVQELRPNKEKLDAESLLSGNVQELAPNEYVIYKPRWGAFYDTPLQSLLKSKNVALLRSFDFWSLTSKS